MVIRVYWASVTGNRKIDGDQARLRNLVESLKLESKWIDITTSRSVMEEMRAGCSNSKAMPPQIFNDDLYLGNVDDMNESVEAGCLKEWLRLETKSVGSEMKTCENDQAQPISELGQPKACILKATEIISASKPVSSVVSSFENSNNNNNNNGSEVARKTIELQSTKIGNENSAGNDFQIDEERKRRILGLSLEADSDLTTDTSTSGMKVDDPKTESVREVEDAA